VIIQCPNALQGLRQGLGSRTQPLKGGREMLPTMGSETLDRGQGTIKYALETCSDTPQKIDQKT